MMSLMLDTFWEPNGSQFWFLYLFLFVVEQTFKILTGRFHPLSRIGDLLNTAPLRNEATPCGPIHHQAPPRCLLLQQHQRLLVSLGLLRILLCFDGVKFSRKNGCQTLHVFLILWMFCFHLYHFVIFLFTLNKTLSTQS